MTLADRIDFLVAREQEQSLAILLKLEEANAKIDKLTEMIGEHPAIQEELAALRAELAAAAAAAEKISDINPDEAETDEAAEVEAEAAEVEAEAAEVETEVVE